MLQLRARRGVVPFYGRDELDVLLDWCQAPEDTARTRVALKGWLPHAPLLTGTGNGTVLF